MTDIYVPANAGPVTIEFAPERPMIDLNTAMRAIVHASQVNHIAIRSLRRKANVVRPRHVFCWLAYRVLGATLGQIGRYLDRDHSTVWAAVRRVDRAIRENDHRYTGILARAGIGDPGAMLEGKR